MMKLLENIQRKVLPVRLVMVRERCLPISWILEKHLKDKRLLKWVHLGHPLTFVVRVTTLVDMR